MKELGIINITQSPEEMQLSTKKEIYKLTTHVINNNNIFEFNKFNEGLLSSMSSKKSTLTGPAMKMAQLLHRLFIHLDKLPIPASTMNLFKFDKPELYNQTLLRKLERGADLSNDDDFLNVDEFLSASQKSDYKSEIILEVDLLKNIDESDFNLKKEEAIKELSCQIGKIYDEIVEVHVEEEIKRRKKF